YNDEINGALFIAVIVPVTLCVPLACILIALVAFRVFKRRQEERMPHIYELFELYKRT
ncbi:Hypothetical predicted protein, partial [Paramuricea clavata]